MSNQTAFIIARSIVSIAHIDNRFTTEVSIDPIELIQIATRSLEDQLARTVLLELSI